MVPGGRSGGTKRARKMGRLTRMAHTGVAHGSHCRHFRGCSPGGRQGRYPLRRDRRRGRLHSLATQPAAPSVRFAGRRCPSAHQWPARRRIGMQGAVRAVPGHARSPLSVQACGSRRFMSPQAADLPKLDETCLRASKGATHGTVGRTP
jgi:hypothetical protein